MAVKVDKDLEEIMPIFLENRKKDIGALSGLLENKDFKAIEVMAHKLAGNAGSYGLPELGEIGSTLEAAAATENIEKTQEFCQKYVDYIENLEIEFE